MQTEIKDIYHIYELESLNFEAPKKRASFWLAMLQATGIFVVITLIVFCIANYPFLKSQIIDWRTKEEEKDNFNVDSDLDALPDWWEKRYGLRFDQAGDDERDSDEDELNNLLEYQFGTDPTDLDTDKDGYFDGEEIKKGYNPNGVGRLDQDKDGIYDWWEEKYGFDKTDSSDAKVDLDQDGLNNLEEFTQLTNPYALDTDRDGKSDGEEVKAGFDPLGTGSMTKEKTVVKQSNDQDDDKIEDFYESLYGTKIDSKDSDQDGFEDFKELSRGYDPTGEGMIKAEIEIPKLAVKAPIVWSQRTEDKSLNTDLENGVVRYPGTAFMGMRGNLYLTGHSSYYSWSKSPYKEIFKNLNSLEEGDKIIIHLSFASGRKADIVYAAKEKEPVKATDPKLFRDYEGYELTLVTCWPIGTDWKRLMIKAYLESPLPE